jgi:7-cyano-7-deazaguanine synthase in queuosine biosynthesis
MLGMMTAEMLTNAASPRYDIVAQGQDCVHFVSLSEGTRDHGKTIIIKNPLIELDKALVVKLGLELNAPREFTALCYEGKERARGRCDPCRLCL